MIEIKNLAKIYHTAHQDIVALDDVSLSVNRGEIFGIIGLSGAGKSTLIRCINMLEKPTQGSIIVDGQDITALKQKELRQPGRRSASFFSSLICSLPGLFSTISCSLWRLPRFPPKQPGTESTSFWRWWVLSIRLRFIRISLAAVRNSGSA